MRGRGRVRDKGVFMLKVRGKSVISVAEKNAWLLY